jgi:mannose-6-phosphate isomerase
VSDVEDLHPYPLLLSFGVRRYAFGGHSIGQRLGKAGLPEGIVAETWEVSDHDDEPATVLNGPYRGKALRELVRRHPDALVRPGWRGPYLPLLVKLLDATRQLPVHVHPDDATAARRYGAPNGKDEAWHVVWAAPGASVLVPGGVLHTFGPDTLIVEVQQTSDLAVSAMPTDVYGRRLTSTAWEAAIDETLDVATSAAQPRPQRGEAHLHGPCRRVVGCRSPRFVLERWTVTATHTTVIGDGGFATLTNLGDAVDLEHPGGRERLDRAGSCLLPATLGEVTLRPHGVADLVVCYEPASAAGSAA